MSVTPTQKRAVEQYYKDLAVYAEKKVTHETAVRRQYQMSEDKRSGIVSDPNNVEDEEYIVRLVGKVVTVSVETAGLVEELGRDVGQGEWLG